MDNPQEGILLIGTTMVLLVAFLITVLAVMIIYRRRRLGHIREMEAASEQFTRELMQAQMEVQRETMHYIGREIHDNVGQKLVLAVLYAGQINTADAAAREKVDAMAAIINESLSDLRGLSKSLTNTHYLQMDLDQLIGHECERVNMTGGCKASLITNRSGIGCSAPVKSFVLRIVQEFLQNSLKYSRCTEMSFRLVTDADGLTITAHDNGIGFDVAMVQGENEGSGGNAGGIERGSGNASGIGIRNMKKRAEIIGADLILSSEQGKGTTMRLYIPGTKLN